MKQATGALRRPFAGISVSGIAVSGVAAGLLSLALIQNAAAQPGGFGGGRGGGGPAAPPAPPRESAPLDLTGTWVSQVTEDWIERMSPDSPASGTGGGFGGGFGGGGGRGGAGRGGAPAISSDDPCAAYGAGGIMRVPGRVRISWQDEDTMLFEYDSGSQRRIIEFDRDSVAALGSSLQGHSTASWQGGGGGGRGRGGPPPGFGAPAGGDGGAAPMRWNSLEVVTTDLEPGYLLTSRSWYGAGAQLTELIRYHNDFDQAYFTVTAIIEENGSITSMTSSTFKKEPNNSGFDPGECTISPR